MPFPSPIHADAAAIFRRASVEQKNREKKKEKEKRKEKKEKRIETDIAFSTRPLFPVLKRWARISSSSWCS
jgi:hypothetical protein